MMPVRKIPPGRAGRLWLRRRLDTATRGRDQLDRKLRILIPERQRLRIQLDQRHAAWVSACTDARTWLLRASLLSGQDAILAATGGESVQAAVVWTTAVGLNYPTDVRLMGIPTMPLVSVNAAVKPAATAYAAALLAGVRTAAASEALHRVDGEIAVTRRRLRAIEKRWLPWLHESLRALELSLEQAEQEDGVRLRRAVASGPSSEGAPEPRTVR
jgi:V/A-type H+/Na+-transporting ATPase subunit D